MTTRTSETEEEAKVIGEEGRDWINRSVRIATANCFLHVPMGRNEYTLGPASQWNTHTSVLVRNEACMRVGLGAGATNMRFECPESRLEELGESRLAQPLEGTRSHEKAHLRRISSSLKGAQISQVCFLTTAGGVTL